jgi:hypothetical protein
MSSDTFNLVVYAMTRAGGTARKSVGEVASTRNAMSRFRAALKGRVPLSGAGKHIGTLTRDERQRSESSGGRRVTTLRTMLWPFTACHDRYKQQRQQQYMYMYRSF